MSLPLRYHVTAALVGLTMISAAALTAFAYRASRESLDEQATLSVVAAARGREQALSRLLTNRHDRMEAFAATLESLCAERTTARRLAWERECVRVVLSGFETAERINAIELTYANRRLAAHGAGLTEIDAPASGQLTSIIAAAGPGEYTMEVTRDRLRVRARFPLDDIADIFGDRSGLDAHGDIFLTDRHGVRLTGLGEREVEAASIDSPMQLCLAGEPTDTHRADAHGVDAIRAFRPVPATGGCAIASVPYSDVLVPIHQLGKRFLVSLASFIVLGAIVALVVARAVTTPLARLAASARELEAGRFAGGVPVAGPREVRELGRALDSMATSVGDLVQREHEARLDAESANRTKDDFLAMLSHELRTPLTAILGWSSIMAARSDDSEVIARGIKAIERSARTQARLVEDLLDVSRIVSGKLRLSIQPQVSLGAVLDAALEAVGPTILAKSITVVKTIDPESTMVAADPGRLQQVIGNLLSNAVRFVPHGGRIGLALSRVGDRVEIAVSDNGIGLSPEFLPHVFERFRQADTSTTRAHGGLGLGLAIARHLVELHGGTIRAESAGPGQGATFVVSLPRLAALPVEPPRNTSREPSVPPLLEGMRILVVDDDAETRSVVRAILEGAGATVTTTASAAETRTVLARTHPDILIADIGMPREDGYSLIRSVRASDDESAGVPAIALTAHVRPDDTEEALAAGFQLHVGKPVDSSKLLSAVTATLLRSYSN